MARKCFISYKTEDVEYKRAIQSQLNVSIIDRSLNIPIDSYDEDYIMRRIRQDYLSDSTVTIFLIGRYSSESLGKFEQRFIKRELQASLYDGSYNTKSGILGVILPEMTSTIFAGSYNCYSCSGVHSHVRIDESTVIKEFHYNYYIPNGKCSWSEEDRYCVLVTWNDFLANPERYIEQAYNKRIEEISNQTKVRP
jgi:hypothetical protein